MVVLPSLIACALIFIACSLIAETIVSSLRTCDKAAREVTPSVLSAVPAFRSHASSIQTSHQQGRIQADRQQGSAKKGHSEDPIKRLLKDNRQEQKRLKKLLNILQQDEEKWQQQITEPNWSQAVSASNTNGKGSSKKRKTGGGKAGLAKVKPLISML